jgi:hypothetical protein
VGWFWPLEAQGYLPDKDEVLLPSEESFNSFKVLLV